MTSADRQYLISIPLSSFTCQGRTPYTQKRSCVHIENPEKNLSFLLKNRTHFRQIEKDREKVGPIISVKAYCKTIPLWLIMMCGIL